jgi:hypothetical protein
MTENARQEIAVPFGGRTFRVRPTFEAIVSIEGALNQSARSVGMKALAAGMTSADRGLQAEISLTELAVSLYWMLRGQEGAPKDAAETGAQLIEEGYADLLLPVGQFLTRAQRGNKIHEQEAIEAARKTKEAGAGDAGSGPTTAG